MRSIIGLVLIVLILVTASCNNSGGGAATEDGSSTPIVTTRSGLTSGIIDNGVFAYLGIPFAAPPVGDLRWRLPEQEAPWTGVFKADKLCPACPQDLSGLENLYGLIKYSEDCLYLNVWVPQGEGPWPVMFWMHGGGFTGGSVSLAMFNGAALAQKDVVVVTANYRLGPLGFMVHQGLFDSQGQAGNYGLYDLIAALEWIRENIAAFGGDPESVTVFGESAGACAISLFQNAAIAEGLYDRAIIQSGTGSSNKYVLNLTGSWQEALLNGEQLQGALGASDIDEMRRIPPEYIIDAVASTGICFGPVMDGVFLSDDPRQAALGPAHAPAIIGTVRDEGTLFIYEYGIETLADYEWALDIWFGSEAGTVQSYFPASNDEEAVWQAVVVLGLAGMLEPVRHTARGASQYKPVYRYSYNHVPPTVTGYYLGCFHGSELAYVFGNLDPNEGYQPEDTQLSQQIMDLWTSFAKTGVPKADGAPDWPEYLVDGQEAILNINGPGDFSLIDGLANDECDFFESIAPVVTPDYPR